MSFLKKLLNYFAKYNFNKIYIIAGYKGDLIKKTFHNKIINLTKVECILEKKLKGTGGALNELKKKKIKNFILSNGDSFCPINLNHFIKDLGNKLIKVSLVKNQNYKLNNLLS
jgi:NDP-sugar pyrophosphorylase family protein